MCPQGNSDSGVESKYCVIKILSPQFSMLQVSCSLSSRISRATRFENVCFFWVFLLFCLAERCELYVMMQEENYKWFQTFCSILNFYFLSVFTT